MLKWFFNILFVVAGTLMANGQVDSLQSVLEKTQGEHKVDVYIKLCNAVHEDSVSRSIYYAEKALYYAREKKLSGKKAEAHYNLGYFYYRDRRFHLALQHYRQSEDMFLKAKDLYHLSYLYNRMANLFIKLDRHDRVTQMYLKAATFKDSIGDTSGLSFVYNNLGLFYWRTSQDDSALYYYRQALKMRQQIGEELNSATVLNNIGVIYHNWNQYEEALQYYLQSMEIRRRKKDHEGVALLLNNIGRTYYDWGKYEKAFDYFEKGFNKSQSIDFTNGIAYSKMNFALVNRKKEHYQAALDNLFEALKAYEEINYGAACGLVSNEISKTYNMMQKPKKAIEWATKGLNIAINKENENHHSMALQNLGMAYQLQGDYGRAIDTLLKSLSISKKIKRPALSIETYQMITEIYEKTGRHKQALHYFRKHQQFQDSIFNVRSQALISDLQLKYETKERERENALLVRQSNLQSRIIKKQQSMNIFISIAAILLVFLTLALFVVNRHKVKTNRLLAHFNKKIIQQRNDLERKNTELNHALQKVKQLSGLLPICASCKKIRDDKGYWNELDAYIRDHSEAEFSHSICPECRTELYGRIDKKSEKQNDGDYEDADEHRHYDEQNI